MLGLFDKLPVLRIHGERFLDTIIDELLLIERRCNRAAAPFETNEFKAPISAIKEAADQIGRSWSGSWFGYQSRVYYANFEPPLMGRSSALSGAFRDRPFRKEPVVIGRSISMKR